MTVIDRDSGRVTVPGMVETTGRRFSGHLLRKARDARGLSRERLARLVDDISTSAITKWERGEQHPGADRLAAVAAVLGVPVESLFSAPQAPRRFHRSAGGA